MNPHAKVGILPRFPSAGPIEIAYDESYHPRYWLWWILGASICTGLLSDGYRVRGIARQRYHRLEAAGVDAIQGDIRDLHDVERACQGIDAIIHTAAIAGVWEPRSSLFESMNVTATSHLLDAAKRANIRRFVYSSSPSVTFDGKPQSGIDESVPYPSRWYCDYPHQSNRRTTRPQSQHLPDGLLTCSLRPHLIWGEGDPHLIPRLIQRCRAGRLRRVGTGNNLIDTVHVDTAAEAHRLALKKLLQGQQEVAGKSYFITDGAPIPCWEWISMLLLAAGLTPPSKYISLRTAFAIGWVSSKMCFMPSEGPRNPR